MHYKNTFLIYVTVVTREGNEGEGEDCRERECTDGRNLSLDVQGLRTQRQFIFLLRYIGGS